MVAMENIKAKKGSQGVGRMCNFRVIRKAVLIGDM